MYTITITTESKSVHEYVLDRLDNIGLNPEPTVVSDHGYTQTSADDTLPERVYDALRASGRKALADEYSDANGAGQ